MTFELSDVTILMIEILRTVSRVPIRRIHFIKSDIGIVEETESDGSADFWSDLELHELFGEDDPAGVVFANVSDCFFHGTVSC